MKKSLNYSTFGISDDLREEIETPSAKKKRKAKAKALRFLSILSRDDPQSPHAKRSISLDDMNTQFFTKEESEVECIIREKGTLRLWWDYIIILLSILDSFIVPLDISFN